MAFFADSLFFILYSSAKVQEYMVVDRKFGFLFMGRTCLCFSDGFFNRDELFSGCSDRQKQKSCENSTFHFCIHQYRSVMVF